MSVVIVNYNTREALRRCLDSIEPEHEVIVVDNGSTDGSAEMVRQYPRVILIANTENRGFGAANNQGIEAATRELVLLLNSDAYTTPGAIARLASLFDDNAVVAAGGKLLNLDGTLQESAANPLTMWAVYCEQTWLEKLFPNSRVFSPYWVSRRLVGLGEGPFAVGQVMGACLMMRPLESFDERFFLYCEDTELCKRLSRHGRILYAPAAEFYHELGTSSARGRWRSIAMYNVGKELYFRIHQSNFASLVCWQLDRLGALMRFVIWGLATVLTLGLVKRFRVQAETFARVLFAPSGYERLK